MKPFSFMLLALLLLMFSLSSPAMEFSAVKLLSGMNEPLLAEIEVTDLEDPDSPVIVERATPVEHRHYRVPNPPFNADIQVTWFHDTDGRTGIRLRSQLPVTDRSLRFLMRVMPTEKAILKQVEIVFPQTVSRVRGAEGVDFKQLSVTYKDQRHSLPSFEPSVGAMPFVKKRKTARKLRNTQKLVRANGQNQHREKILAFDSPTDSVSYDPEFSRKAIAAISSDRRIVEKELSLPEHVSQSLEVVNDHNQGVEPPVVKRVRIIPQVTSREIADPIETKNNSLVRVEVPVSGGVLQGEQTLGLSLILAEPGEGQSGLQEIKIHGGDRALFLGNQHPSGYPWGYYPQHNIDSVIIRRLGMKTDSVLHRSLSYAEGSCRRQHERTEVVDNVVGEVQYYVIHSSERLITYSSRSIKTGESASGLCGYLHCYT